MPLSSKGEKILGNMTEHYGSKKQAEQVLYASANAGKITGIHDQSMPSMPPSPATPSVPRATAPSTSITMDECMRDYHDACRRGDATGIKSMFERMTKSR